MALDPALDAQLRKPIVTMFGALKIVLPGHTITLCDGSGVVKFGGDTYTGRDSTYGAIESIQAFTDGVSGEDPTLQITLLPPTNVAAAGLADPTHQGAAVYLYVGAVDTRTGLPVGAPVLRFLGEIDVPTLIVDRNVRKLQYDVVSAFERFFTDDEGVRLSDAWHQSLWPGETGLQGITTVQRKLPWGSDAPTPAQRIA